MKFVVTYSRNVIYTGTIEAESLDDARNQWDNGFTPSDEVEIDSEGEDLKSIEEVDGK